MPAHNKVIAKNGAEGLGLDIVKGSTLALLLNFSAKNSHLRCLSIAKSR